jgi:CheY-like chemotaxis protein
MSERGLIVVADDDPEIRDVLIAMFEREGFEVHGAAHGGEAIDVLQHVPTPDGVFVDLMMPGIVGHSVLEYLRNEPRFRSVPVAIVSSAPELAPAGYRVFKKPVAFNALLDFLRQTTQTSPA